jgi:peptidoglycan/LPS O-acetylase OafA/YrhL
MAKRRKSTSPQSRSDPPSPSQAGQATLGRNGFFERRNAFLNGRNGFLDGLRGLAILLMVVDHVTGILFQIPIPGSSIRLATRLSMPLFCVLMGYLLKPQPLTLGLDNRLVQISLAAVLANLVFWPYYGVIEILGSLLVAYLLFIAMRSSFVVLVLAILVYPIDPLKPWFDYPPSIVVSFVAQGLLLRRFGIGPALILGAFLAVAAFWIRTLEPLGHNHLMCLFALPATLLVFAGERLGSDNRQIRSNHATVGLVWLGQHPLRVYLVQYYIILGLAYALLR